MSCNIDHITKLKLVLPFEIVKPIKKQCNADQLKNIEECNKSYIETQVIYFGRNYVEKISKWTQITVHFY